MPDLLAHAFLGYSILQLLSWRYDWLSAPYVTAGMAGALIPDMVKVDLLIPAATVEALFGVPFSWSPLSTLGGVVISILIGVILVYEGQRKKIFLVLSLGAASHLIADAFLIKRLVGHTLSCGLSHAGSHRHQGYI